MNLEYESFDMEYFEKKRSPSGKIHEEYTKEDGTRVMIGGKLGMFFYYSEYPPAPSFYVIDKEYYGDGKLMVKGIKLPKECRIGQWLECDEEGNCRIVDYDKNMGRFNYKDVLKFLDKRGYVNLKTGAGKDKVEFGYNYESKTWVIEASKNNIQWKRYILDGNTGKLLEEEVLPIKN